MRSFFKAFLGLSAVAGMLAAVTSMGVFGVVAESKRWCKIPCYSMRQTCDDTGKTPDGALVCAVVNNLVQDWKRANGQDVRGDMRGRSIEWKHTATGEFQDAHGRIVTGLGGWQVGLQPGEKPCRSALKHELWHPLMKKYKGGNDAAHKHVSWKLADNGKGCDKEGAHGS